MSTTWGVECAPAKKRGLLITLFPFRAIFGNLVVSCVCLGIYQIPSDWSWKAPILCQIPVALTFGGGLFIFPESPRWLLKKGKTEAARKSFGRLYNKNSSSDEITIQIRDVQLTIETERELSSTTRWTEIFHRHHIKRTAAAAILFIGGALSGAFFIFSYAALFFEGLGISPPIMISVIINACLAVGVSFGPFFVEYLGRRRTIFTGYLGMMICMLTFSAVSSGLGISNKITRDVLIAFLCLWAFMFGGFVASSQWVTAAEMHAVRLRTSGQAFITALANVFVFATNFWTPYMLNAKYGNMGTRVGYFYFGMELGALIILYLLVPETGRLTLEQIDEYFLSGRKPWQTSLKRNKRIARGELTIGKDE